MSSDGLTGCPFFLDHYIDEHDLAMAQRRMDTYMDTMGETCPPNHLQVPKK